MFSVNFEIRNPVLIEEKNYTDKVNRGGGAGGGGKYGYVYNSHDKFTYV